jgi:hypothetical protein
MPIFPPRRSTATARRRPSRRVEHRLVGLEALESRLALAIDVNVVDNTHLGTAGSIFVTGHGIPGNAPAGSAPQQLRVVGASGGFVQGAVTIDNALCTGTTARITTSVAHQLTVGNTVYVSGVGVPGYNGVFTVTDAAPKWFQYTVPSALSPSQGGAAYLPPLLSSQTITQAEAQNGLVTLTLQNTANVPLNSPIFISGLGGVGAAWNGTAEVKQNASTNPALTSKQFQIEVSSASGTATVTNASVRIVSVNPIALARLPGWTAQNKTGKVTLDLNIEGFSSQLVQMVTPAGAAPYPLGIVPGTANLTNLGIPPFAVGQQAGTSVVDVLEFVYAGPSGNSTFDLSGVDGFVLPLTLTASSVSAGPQTVGLNTSLPNLSREQIGNAFKDFIGYEPFDVRMTGQFSRLLYDQSVSTNKLAVAPASQAGTALTGVSLQPDKDLSSAGLFTGSISGTTLTVTSGATNLAKNKIIDGVGVLPNTYVSQVVSQSGGAGTFTVNQSQNVASTNMTGYNPTGVITATKTANGLVPGQSITVSAPGSAYNGNTYTVKLTPLNDTSLSSGQFTFVVPAGTAPDAIASATVTPTNSGVIASGVENLVVTVTAGPLPAAGSTVQLSNVPQGGFSPAGVNGPYTVVTPPTGSGLPANAVYLATTTGQTFKVGNTTGGGTLSTPVFVAPPAVPGNQFYAITAPKDWLANQLVATANADPMVTWWDTTVNNFFKAGNYLNVSIGSYVPTSTPNVSITDIRNSGSQTIFTATNTYAVGDVVIIAGFPADPWYNQTSRIVAANGASFTVAGTSTPPDTMPAGAIAQLSRAISYTGTFGTDGGNGTGFSFTPDHTDYPAGFTSPFWIHTPTPQNVFGTAYSTQSQSLANATWVWAQANIPDTAPGTVWDQIVQAFCRGVALDGVLTATPTAGQSNAGWTTTDNWYRERMTPAGIMSVYCPYSKFLHFGTLSGGTDRTGATSIYTGGLAYGFSEDEIPAAADGLPGASVGGPSKMDGTVPDGATMTLIVNPWIGGTPQSPSVSSIDTIPPQSPPGTPTPTSATTLSWTVSFSEPVKGVTLDDFVSSIVSGPLALDLKGVTANSGTALSQTWTVTGDVTGTGTGVIGVNLTKAGSITDASGTPLTLPAIYAGETYRVTTNPVGPTAAIVIAGTNPTNLATVPFTVTFSQAVTGLTPANFTTVAGGGVTDSLVQGVQVVSGSGNAQYTVTVNTGSGSGTLALQLASAAGLTPAPTGLPVTSAAYTIDKNDPTKAPEVQGIALAGASPTSAASVAWTVTFTEPVTGLTAANFAIAASGLGGTPTITSVTPASATNTATWTVTASTGSGSGTLGLNMANSTNVRDADSQAVTNLPFTGAVYTVDRTAPAAQSIVRANASPTTLSAVSWTVTFSEAISGLSQENFQLAATGLKGAQATNVAPAVGSAPSAVWTVTAATGSGSGSLRLDLENARGITDAVNLPPTGIPLTGQSYTVSRGGATNVDVPIAFMTTMGKAAPLRWLMNPFTDRDSVQLTATLSASPGAAAGTFRAASGAGVTVSPSGTAAAELTFTGTVANLNAYFRNAAGFIRYTPAGSSLAPRTLSLSAEGSDGLSGIATAALLVRAAAPQSPAPALNAAARLAGTVGQPLVITYAQLVAATGATQTTSRSVQFMLAGLSSGRLEVWSGGRWTAMPALANLPLLAPGGRIRWTPPAGGPGVRPAFSVKAWDGWRMSGVSQVAVNLAR